MNIGIRLHDVCGDTLEQKLQNAKAQGFRCAHVALSKVIAGFEMNDAPKLLTPAFAAQLRALFARYDMRIAVLGCYLNPATPDMEEYQRNVEIYKAHLRFAPLLGAEVVGTETGNLNTAYAPDEESHTPEALRLLIERLAPLVRCAQDCGTVLAIEPVCRHIVDTPERAAQVLSAYPTRHLAIILDMVNLLNMRNYLCMEAMTARCEALFGDRIRVLHMKDFRMVPGGTDVKSVACGTGLMEYSSLLALARSRGGLPMTLENTCPENAEAARAALENWQGRPKAKKVLFIGNSHTFCNDLCEIVRQECALRGLEIEPTMLTLGGAGLEWHAKNQQTQFNLRYGHYALAVLQHRANPVGDLDLLLESARTIARWARAAGTKTLLYETWTMKGCADKQPAMSAAYEMLSRELQVPIAPVGDRWQEALAEDPSLEFYMPDHEHASPLGATLAAEVLAEAIVKELNA